MTKKVPTLRIVNIFPVTNSTIPYRNYDERNRLIKKTLPNNNQVTYTYTLTGQRATEINRSCRLG
ncbi:MAG: RHS repeat protein [Pseudanabaena sp. M090S1SP1A06QC]|nr:RHS repeat protein [Pseudanabaena sp. M53BS1SP1A06MG]MCA6583743.1 RHS repeat protein [Pseudanabaena sp. M34BS1SP1A06MG]MCA6586985.1 RHS repeat protein [Pseudanabaena sp. M051S1SP1A06QC]MCA6594432.1 RHS repeat protein [Pseudanabaena sp. M38BS1SP1A06MG]MCA6602806.1 RHS repeat protein [Pseudanabaena sp. M57BS1SP1A06MG]MCA6604303.1 RHS repeat protein [Pseudanabaena sp. M007S1SP1A06QC]MCA6616244.1 RHS repeat protein [Pseudanabaena sp. M090S1SP1A06QC]